MSTQAHISTPDPAQPRLPGHPHDQLLTERGWPRDDLAHFPSRQLRDVRPEHLRPWPFPAFLDHPSCRWLQALKRIYADPLSFPASVSPEAGLLLHALVRNHQPRVVVETGTFIGISTIWMAAALAELPEPGTLHSIDWFSPVEPGPWRTARHDGSTLPLVESHLCDAGVSDRVRLHQGPTVQTLHALSRTGQLPRVQLAFLDADHSEHGLWDELRALEPILDTGGLVIIRDSFPDLTGLDGPRRVLDAVNEKAVGGYQALDLCLAPVNYGFGLLRRIA